MQHLFRVNRLAVATLATASLASFAQAGAPAAAAVAESEALAAARHGAQWIVLLQETDGELGSFGGDWSMTALAAVGVNAADVRTGPLEPSAQDFYLSAWTGESSGLSAATDYERAILTGYAGGLQPSRLDAQTNLVADLAAQFDGHDLGGQGATNADAFGALALDAIGAPSDVIEVLAQRLREQQDADGGWDFAAGTRTSEADTTGAAIAALCLAGAGSQDPALVRALAYLQTVQDSATGGFFTPAGRINTDSTSWVVSGLRACGVDPQGTQFTTTAGKTPLDFLLAQQNSDGSFQSRAGDEEEDLYATQDAVRALAGAVFTAPPPPRTESGQPAVRPAPTVAAGTAVPMTLVIDSGGHVTGGSSIRMCKVTAAVGATVAQLLADAEEASLPAYCVSDLSLAGGRIVRLNGVASEPGLSSWVVRREGAAPEVQTSGTVGLGALVQLQLTDTDETPFTAGETPLSLPPGSGAGNEPVISVSAPAPATHTAAGVFHLRVRLRALTRVHGGHLSVELECPRTIGAAGCAGRVRVRVALRARRGGAVRPRLVGQQEVHLAAGASGTVRIALSRAVLQALRTRGDRVAWVLAALRDPRSGALTGAAAATVLR